MAFSRLLVAVCVIITLFASVMIFSESFAQPSTGVSGATEAEASLNATSQGNLTCALTSKDDSYEQIPWAYPLAALIIVVTSFVGSRIIRGARNWLISHGHVVVESNCKKGSYEGGFWDMIREGDYYPSLARFQFMLWTFVISFTLLSIYFLMLGNHTLCWSGLSQNILTLMGISAAVPIIGNVLSREKYKSHISGSIPCRENVPAVSTMLMEHSKPTLGRFQMFLWTIISVLIYLGLFISQVGVISDMNDLMQLQLPDIDSSLLFLMGLSQAGYLGAKLVARPVAADGEAVAAGAEPAAAGAVSRLSIVGRYPTKNQTDIKRSTDIVVNFGDSLDSTSVNSANFDVRNQKNGSPVEGNVRVLAEDDRIAIFDPSTDLEPNTWYTVKILKNIKSKNKEELENDESWSFRTGP